MNELAQNNQSSPDQPSPDQPSPDQPTPGDQRLETAQPARKFRMTWQLAAGFLGWFLVNGGLWLLLLDGSKFNPNEEGSILTNGICIFPLNLTIMAFLLWKKETRQIGQGILAAYAVNFAVSLVLGLSTNAVCLVPFFN